MLVRELIQDILDEIGQLVGGNPASDTDAAKCRRLINKCVREYNVQGFLHFCRSRLQLGQGKEFLFEDKIPLNVNAVYYKIGPNYVGLTPVQAHNMPAYEGVGCEPYKFAYETANKPVEPEEYESKVSELDSLEFTFNNLKDSYEEDYKEKLNFKLTPRKVQTKPADDASNAEIPPIPADVELTEDQLRVWKKPTTSKDERNAIIAKIRDKAKEEADKKEKEEKARSKKLDAMRGHLKTLGIGMDTNVMKALLEAQKTTDPMIRRALDEVTAFLRSDKDFKTYADLKKLLK